MATNAVRCPLCGLEEPFDADGELPPPLHEIGLFRCEGCSARYVHGRLLPRVVVEPHDGGRGVTWARLRFQDPATKRDEYVVDLDPKFALMILENVLQTIALDPRAAVRLAHYLLSKVIT